MAMQMCRGDRERDRYWQLTAAPLASLVRATEAADALANECITRVKTLASCNGQKTMIEVP